MEPLKDEVWFSNNKPAKIKVGDELICYVVYRDKSLAGHYRVLSEPEKPSDSQRWTYVSKVENLLESFSKSWWLHNIDLSIMEQRFISENAGNDILTNISGSSVMAAIMAENSYIEITKEFAEYLISEMKRCVSSNLQ